MSDTYDVLDSAVSTRSPQPARVIVAQLVLVTTTALLLGGTLKTPVQVGANDTSRWCTVWSLVERGTYVIDECPWRTKTIDKVLRSDKLEPTDTKSGPLKRLEYAIAPRSWKEGETAKHSYSSKPPLLPTLIAGMIYPFRALSGVPLDYEVEQAKLPRYVEKTAKDGTVTRVLETPEEPFRWPAQVFYFEPVLILINVVPLIFLMVLYSRLLDRYAPGEWSWYLPLFAAAFATLVYPFHQTLNNHSTAFYAAFFALYAMIRIHELGAAAHWGYYALAGFMAGFCACNEIPAASFGVLIFLILLGTSWRKTVAAFVPAAAVPILAFLVTQFLAFGTFVPVYNEFGTEPYNYDGSYWNTPLEMDWFNKFPESRAIYLFHMTFGHHGIFSLTPLFLFSIYGAFRLATRRGGALRSTGMLTVVLTLAMVGFYAWNPKARNYGGSAAGLRWLFWLIPFWLVTLPEGLRGIERSRGLRWLALAALGVSVVSVGYALRSPWSHPWALDLIEHFDLYQLNR